MRQYYPMGYWRQTVSLPMLGLHLHQAAKRSLNFSIEPNAASSGCQRCGGETNPTCERCGFLDLRCPCSVRAQTMIARYLSRCLVRIRVKFYVLRLNVEKT